jgi:ADP-ribosyl-[dinitrogen reductase] hydrolase
MNNKSILKTLTGHSFEDRAYGCILGAFIADSCGSYLEFSNEIHCEDTMNECMTMPGGGPHNVGPGQVTDDSELAMCLMWGIIKGNETKQGIQSK